MERRKAARKARVRRRKRLTVAVAVLACLAVAAGAGLMIWQKQHFSIELNGGSEIEIGLNGVYEEKGAKAVIDGKDVSDKIKVSGSVDPSKPGKYEITYEVEGIKAVRKVTVGDRMDPVIELAGNKKTDVKLGETFSEPGYEAKDDDGTDLTGKVEVSYEGLKKAGERKISYTAKDSDGNMTRVYRDVTVEPNTSYDTPGLAICMYHYVYDKNDPPEDLKKRYGNYISTDDLAAELAWLNEEGYYYPTWKEVRDYIDGKLILPEKSIVLAFDDGAMSFLENGIPVLEKYKVPATCFMITSSNGENKIKEYASDYVTYESHSHNMHRGGGNIGHGGIFPVISEEEGLADLKKSIEICKSGDAFAYPYGDYNDRCVNMVKEAGFLCAVTTEPGKAKPGDDPLLLPRVRMVNGQSLDSFINKVAPR